MNNRKIGEENINLLANDTFHTRKNKLQKPNFVLKFVVSTQKINLTIKLLFSPTLVIILMNVLNSAKFCQTVGHNIFFYVTNEHLPVFFFSLCEPKPNQQLKVKTVYLKHAYSFLTKVAL